jgi:hypothetical protein
MATRRLPRTTSIQRRPSYCFSLWNAYYTLFVVVIQVYLLNKYANKIFSDINDFNRAQDNATRSAIESAQQMVNIVYGLFEHVLIAMLAIILIVTYVITSVRPTGNFSNDYFRFGNDDFVFIRQPSRVDHTKTNGIVAPSSSPATTTTTRVLAFGHTVWKHFLPPNSLCHLCLAFTYIFVQVDMHTMVIDTFQPSTTTVNDTRPFATFFIQNQLELVNYFLALFVLTTRYASVFWSINKTLASLMSFIGVYVAFEQLLQIYSYTYLSACAKSVKANSMMTSNTMILKFVYVLHACLQIMCMVPLYAFVYSKYMNRLLNIDNNDDDNSYQAKPPNTFIQLYCTNMIAIVHLVVLCVCKMPFIYDYFVCYYERYDYGVMLLLCIELIFVLVYIFVWLLLTLKVNWSIRLEVYDYQADCVDSSGQSMDVCQSLNNTETAYRDQIRKSIHTVMNKAKFLATNLYDTNPLNLSNGYLIFSSGSTATTTTGSSLTTTKSSIVNNNDAFSKNHKYGGYLVNNCVDGLDSVVTKQAIIRHHAPKSRRHVFSLDLDSNTYVEHESRV